MEYLITNPHEFGFLSDYIRWEDEWGKKTLKQKVGETKILIKKFKYNVQTKQNKQNMPKSKRKLRR